MPSPEEISAWSEEELLTEIRVRVPPGSQLRIEAQPGYYLASVRTSEGALLYEESNPDRRLALLNIFGAVWVTPSVSGGSPWLRRRDLPRRPLDVVERPDIPDPEDLDPEEVQALYLR